MNLAEKQEIQRIARAETQRTFRELQKKEANRKEADTRDIMRKYKDAMFHLENINTEEITELDGEFIDRLEGANMSTRIMVRNVNRALKEIERRRKEEGRQQEYRAFELHFVKGLSYEKATKKLEEEIQEKQAPSTLKRWCDSIIKELAVLLWGI